ncbi:hypothetical protein PBT90_03425 [Algoriphagus halophytocola]|uniref:Uncharacterized protein n=1 Tax=Algoriphagus halophytocola TaxID=2991499 RepID=A0ABY6MF82_9BACT|nr:MULTISPECIES: hypothetical protein [unclassified Algoriphagus]UZD22478.1 hypothetical protein OM944_17705 [Algoriphagus sp. TR-M5]WBL43738.1 hypothetical protein PBT90_03425 [Algoriphagus sp. TR-M9]
MRKLSEQEITSIHVRLKSLHIRYTEVYEEIFDHYYSTLENVSQQDSPAFFTNLNETFTSSVVKKMNKELEKNVSKQVTKLQLEIFKPWKQGLLSSLWLFLTVIISIFIAYFLGENSLRIWVGVITIITLVILLTKDRALFRFNLPLKDKNTVRAANQIVLSRLGFVVGTGIYSLLNLQYFKFERMEHYSEFYSIGYLFYFLMVIYAFSLIRIVISRELVSGIKTYSS